MELTLQPPPVIAPQEEVRLLRAALQRNPELAPIRARLGVLLNDLDRHADTVALLEAGSTTAEEWITLADARFALRQTAAAGAAARRSGELALTPVARSRALAGEGKAAAHAGEYDRAVALFEQALALSPGSGPAFKRLANELLRAGQPQAVLELCERMVAQGVDHARAKAARTMALAMLGEAAEARAVADFAHSLHTRTLPPPSGWGTLEDFNAAVLAELLANPEIRFEKAATSSDRSWRVDAPALGGAPAVEALLGTIGAAVSEYAAQRAHAPARARLNAWCVIAEAEGSEGWHTHPFGWISGGYYVAVPEAVVNGTDPAGCFALGLPSGLIGQAAADAFGETLVRPYAGLLTLFPSHAYHRTWPHHTAAKRACLAFDVIPS